MMFLSESAPAGPPNKVSPRIRPGELGQAAGSREDAPDARARVGELEEACRLLLRQAEMRKEATAEQDRQIRSAARRLKKASVAKVDLEERLRDAKAEVAMLTDVLDQQAERCVKSERYAEQLEDKLGQVKALLKTTVEEAKVQAAKAREWKQKEADAVGEVNRRAVQQAKLRETIQHLQAQADRDLAASSQAVDLQEQLSQAHERVRQLEKDREQDRLRFVAQSAAGVPRESGGTALQEKLDKQTLEVIRLKTELAKRERALIEHKDELEEVKARHAQDVAATKAAVRAVPVVATAAVVAGSGEPSNSLREELEALRERSREKEAALNEQIQARDALEESLKAQVARLEADLEAAQTASRQQPSQEQLESSSIALDAQQQQQQQQQQEIKAVREQAREREESLNEQIAARDALEASLKAEVARLGADLVAAQARLDAAPQQVSEDAEVDEPSEEEEVVPQDMMDDLTALHALCKAQSEQVAALKVDLLAHEQHQAVHLEATRDVAKLREECARLRQEAAAPKAASLSDQDLAQEAGDLHSKAQEIANFARDVLKQTMAIQQQQQVQQMRLQSPPVGSLRQVDQFKDAQDQDEDEQDDDAVLPSPTEHRSRSDSAHKRLAAIEQSSRHRSSSAFAWRFSDKVLENVRSLDADPDSDVDDDDDHDHGRDHGEDDIGGEENDKGENTSGGDAQSKAERNGVSEKPMVVHRGFLLKAPRGSGLPYWTRWGRRWFVLTNTTLFYFKAPSSRMPKQVMDLGQMELIPPQDMADERALKFYLRVPYRTYVLCAENRGALESWLPRLRDAIAVAKDNRKIAAALARQASAASLAPPDNGADGASASAAVEGKDAGEQRYPFETFYDVLNVPHEASQTEITKAHEVLAADFHPDVNPNPSEAKFELLTKAYGVLGTPALRADYDTSLNVKMLFLTGFVALLHPESSRRKLKARLRRFYSDKSFEYLFWAAPDQGQGDDDLIFDDDAIPRIAWVDVVAVRPGEDSIQGPLASLPSDRAKCCLSLTSSESQTPVNIEVDSRVERDKLVAALLMLVNDKRDAATHRFVDR
ncbi:Chaperone protein DnaJ 2 [Durusdinium trenchii]|uniref:Chaperone protein DnaJ 2 n=1 Tax=Durusdinium trenchii TaxID=1381693 RepID=A0ABP0I4L7_9DINO